MPIAASVSMSLMFPVSTNNFMIAPPLLVLYGVGQLADAFHLHHHRVPGMQLADTRRRAGGDDVSGLERHHERDVLDQEVHREDELRRRGGLPLRAIDPRLDGARAPVEPGGNARTDGRKG